jgi:UDP-N-acetyl-D-galactosamine dehydrogenase
MKDQPTCIAVIGLGYVGLPLVVAFGRTMRTIGFDLSESKVQSCRQGQDPSRELQDAQIAEASQAEYTSDSSRLAEADIIIVAVPTPIGTAHVPNLSPLVEASQSIGRHIKRGATVIFESTVYPGATEEVCIPVIEASSGLTWKRDFWVGYSPERINPGDQERTLTKILKIVSGDTPETLDRVAALYEKIIEPGVYRASSIKVAEAAKVIENTQRDLNIALMNELAIIFDRIGIDSTEVLEAAGTKWNFIRFTPGLVGGHCIGVDPYYLTHKAEMLGYHPQVILAGRRINDSMGKFIAEQAVKQMVAAGSPIKDSLAIILGLTFKENCADLRNSKVIDVIRELESYSIKVVVTDPLADAGEAAREYGVELVPWDELPRANIIVAAVPHNVFLAMSVAQIAEKFVGHRGVFVDVKSAFDAHQLRRAGHVVWRL